MGVNQEPLRRSRVRSFMTRIADLGPPPVPGKPQKPGNGHDHFHECPICGQRVDRRDLRQVLWHEQPDHEPLELDN